MNSTVRTMKATMKTSLPLKGYSGQLGLGDINDRRVPTLVGAEEVFGGSKVRTIACGYFHTLVVTEAGDLWAYGHGAQGDRLVPTRVDPLHFAHAPISAVAACESHSAALAVTEGGALYTWGQGEAVYTGPRCPEAWTTPRRFGQQAGADAGAAAAAGWRARGAVPRAA